jgi:NAD(P)-dependent dehydrogenase (short-subunit alcohol dehydrogenase family)
MLAQRDDAELFAAARRELFVALVGDVLDRLGGTAEKSAKLVPFLGSDESSFITGSDFVIDGGFVSGAATKEFMRTLEAVEV